MITDSVFFKEIVDFKHILEWKLKAFGVFFMNR